MALSVIYDMTRAAVEPILKKELKQDGCVLSQTTELTTISECRKTSRQIITCSGW